ncbi:phage minor capsid protein [Sporosarcina sp. FSL K6-3457]|uniref:phage minor capsid protein n=1 Tax=Sporosarcina sp. FSL K6-3457 TaxID=2978204 RepID=UPI0030F72338
MSRRIDPYQLNLYTSQVTDIYIALEDEIFRMISKRLKTPPELGKDYVLQWQVEKMQQLRMLNADTIKELSKATGLSASAIRQAVNDVGFATIEGLDDELKNVKQKLLAPTQIDVILESFVKQSFREIDNFVNQTLITTNYGEGSVTNMYRKIVEESTGKVLAGTKTINQAVAETIVKWGNKGIATSFVDKGGNVWDMERYVETVVRSTVNNTYNNLRLSRMDEYGVDLVLVSSYADAREICSKIQGQVASMSNPTSNEKYPSIYDYGYGTPGGIRGINCRHILFPFIEGVNTNNQPQYDPEEAAARGKLVQKQRGLERDIRKAKREYNIANELKDKDAIAKARNKILTRQGKLREFIGETGLPRRRDKEQLIINNVHVSGKPTTEKKPATPKKQSSGNVNDRFVKVSDDWEY